MATARVEDWKSPDYAKVFLERRRRMRRARAAEGGWDKLVAYYREEPVDFVEDWGFTYDPRRLQQGLNPSIPFVLFRRQREFVAWCHDRMMSGEPGIVEKSRDVGISWLMVGFAAWAWTFVPGAAVGFGSYKKEKVDAIGDLDSLLEKFRFFVRNLPLELRPIGYDEKRDANFMRIVNPETGATVTGEVGDNVGRGGRKTIYFIDEFAHFEHADTADAALSQNTPCRVYASTVHGMGNLFARKRHGGAHPVFVFDWREDPRKDGAWYRKQQEELEPHILAQEVDRDYHAAVERTIIDAKWIRAAQEVGPLVRKWPQFGGGVGGLDVGGGGTGKSVFCARFGPFVDPPEEWTEPDGAIVASLAHEAAVKAGVVRINYDEVGIGAGVAVSVKRIEDLKGIRVSGVNVGTPPTDRFWPDGKRSSQKFLNLKAELWWMLRDRFQKTWEHVRHLKGEGGKAHPLDELVVLPQGAHELAHQLSLPTWDVTSTMKIKVESKESLRRRGVKSPDHAEALTLTLAPEVDRLVVEHVEGMY